MSYVIDVAVANACHAPKTPSRCDLVPKRMSRSGDFDDESLTSSFALTNCSLTTL